MGLGSIVGAVAAPIIGNALFPQKKQTVSQGPMRTPEQIQADQMLLNFAKTGKLSSGGTGDFGPDLTGVYNTALKFGQTGMANQIKAKMDAQNLARAESYANDPGNGYDAYGGQYAGPLGNFELSDLEKQGLSSAGTALNGGPNKLMAGGATALLDFLNTDQYDPYNPKGQFASLSAGIDRNTREAQDNLKRQLAVTGNLYSSTNARESGNIEEGAAIDKNQTMARLADEFLQRKLSAIPLAFQGAQAEEGINRGRVADAFTYGGIERQMKDVEAQRQYQDFIRLRQEAGLPVEALKAVSGASATFGVPSVTMPQENPWAQTIQLLSQLGGQAFANKGQPFNNPGAPLPTSAYGYQNERYA